MKAWRWKDGCAQPSRAMGVLENRMTVETKENKLMMFLGLFLAVGIINGYVRFECS